MENEKSNFEKRPETLNQLESRLNGEVADFFETKPLNPNITTFGNKDDFDQAYLKSRDNKITEVPDWVVAFASKNSDNIYILSPDVMPKGVEESGYNRFAKTLKHEIGHLYTKNINSNTPSWLNEGISLYLADQNIYKKMDHEDISIKLLDELEDANSDPRIYQVGWNMANELIKLGGKDLLLEIASTEDKDDRDIILMELFDWLRK